jgi:tryptophan synthase alpha chain
MSRLHDVFTACRTEDRAALIGYLPAGYPSRDGAVECITAMAEGGVDIIEIGLPYSDPVMDGPTIQAAVESALQAGTHTSDVLATVEAVASAGIPALVMSYWNPIERYGQDRFAKAMRDAGGLGVITPDLTPEEAGEWTMATDAHGIDRVFLVALSSTNERIATVCAATTGFVYAGAVMGVTGARASVSASVEQLVARTRVHTDLPVAVGLGVSTPAQVADIARYADGVIVGSAFVNAIDAGGPAAARQLAAELAEGLKRS